MRHIGVELTYQGKNITKSIQSDLTSFSYDEKAAGTSDSLSLTLANKSLKWLNGWFPETGDQIHGKFLTYDWSRPGEINALDYGSMVVDEPEFTGPPNVFTLKALSVPAAAGYSDTPADHTWTKISMKQLGQSIAKKYGLSFLYDAPDFIISSLKQSNQTDSDFLTETASKYNLCVKIFSNRLVIYSKAAYEKRAPVAMYTLGKSNISSYQLYAPTVGTGYSAVIESYKPPNSKKQLSYTFRVPGTSGGKTLTVNESADDLAQAEMIAKAKLRESNEQMYHGTLTVALNLRLAAACIIQLAGFGKFDGNYFTDSATHSGGDQAGQTEVEIHKCLKGGY
jgi:phage protein D